MEKNNSIKMKRSNAELNRFIEFGLGNSDYAIPLSMVREVISLPDIAPILRSPAHFLGVINLRGQVISVIDLRKKLKVESIKNKEEAVIIVDIGGVNIGVVVDSINKVLAFSSDEIREISHVEMQLESQFIFGTYKKEYSVTILLDIAKVIDMEETQAIYDSKIAA